VWDLRTRTVVGSAEFSEDTWALALHEDQLAAGRADFSVDIVSVATGERRLQLLGHSHYVPDAAFSPDGTRLVTASWDRTLRLWDARSGAQLAVLEGHEHRVIGVSYVSEDVVASASWDGSVRLWDLTQLQHEPKAVLHDVARDFGLQLHLARPRFVESL